MARIILIVIFLGGCFFDTSDDIPFGVQSDESPVPFFDVENVQMGMLCDHNIAGGKAECDPVLQNCGDGNYCDFDLNFDAIGKSTKAVCKPSPSEKMEGTRDEECNSGVCAKGFFCVSGICRRFCELKSAFGCEEDQFCDDPFRGTHGVCLDSCR